MFKKNGNRAKTGLLVCLVATVMASIYVAMRLGFESQTMMVVKVLGTLYFIVLAPVVIEQVLANKGKFLSSGHLPIAVGVLLLICLAGLFRVEIPFYAAGIIFLLYYAIISAKDLSWRWLIYIPFTLLIAVDMAGNSWARETLSPTYLEGIVAGVLGWNGWNGTDTLHHATIAQMIGTYGIPSTGIDGLPVTNYHFGSHYLFAGLSGALGVPVILTYNIAFPVLFAPLLIYAMMMFAGRIRPLTVTSFLVIAFFLLRIIRHYFAAGGLGNTFLLSESSTLSILFLLFVFDLLLFYWQDLSHHDTTYTKLFLLAVISLAIFIMGFMKISTFMVFEGVLWYTFVRMQLYKRTLYNIFMLMQVVVAVVVLYYTMETLPFGWRTFEKDALNSTSLEPFAFFTGEVPIFDFVLLFTFSVAAFVAAINSRSKPAAEIVLVTAIMGLLPVALLKLYYANYMYFLLPQFFLGAVVLAAYIPAVTEKYKRISAVILAAIFMYLYIPVGKRLKQLLYVNVETRNEITGTKASEINGSLGDYFARWNDSRKDDKLLASLRSDPYYIFLQQLQQLNELPHWKKQTSLLYIDVWNVRLPPRERTKLVYVDESIHRQWMLHCYDLPLMATALSGLSLLDGMPCHCNNLSSHGYIAYPDKIQCSPPELTEDELKKIKVNGIKSVFVYNNALNKFEEIELSGG